MKARAVITAIMALGWLWPGAAAAANERGYDAFRNRNYCRILYNLEVIYRAPSTAKNRFLIAEPIWRTGQYAQCLIAPDRSSIVCEVASGQWLRPVRPLIRNDRLAALLELGFAANPENGNYRLARPLMRAQDLRDVAELYLRVFYDAYNAAPEADLVLTAPLVRHNRPIIRDPVEPDCIPVTS